jgi:hypothetical protein
VSELEKKTHDRFSTGGLHACSRSPFSLTTPSSSRPSSSPFMTVTEQAIISESSTQTNLVVLNHPVDPSGGCDIQRGLASEATGSPVAALQASLFPLTPSLSLPLFYSTLHTSPYLYHFLASFRHHPPFIDAFVRPRLPLSTRCDKLTRPASCLRTWGWTFTCTSALGDEDTFYLGSPKTNS